MGGEPKAIRGCDPQERRVEWDDMDNLGEVGRQIRQRPRIVLGSHRRAARLRQVLGALPGDGPFASTLL